MKQVEFEDEEMCTEGCCWYIMEKNILMKCPPLITHTYHDLEVLSNTIAMPSI